jgi:hypothetical protein
MQWLVTLPRIKKRDNATKKIHCLLSQQYLQA